MSIKEYRQVYGSKLKLIGGYLFRWVGFPVEPQLVKIGNPDESSPVILTCNFNLTVYRVIKAVQHLDCWLLIAPSNGINVWCGACGDDFLTDSVISVLKTSKIEEKVNHRTLILPQLSATGIDPEEIKEKTGWHAKFGPVYAEDLPAYFEQNEIKTPEQSRVKFPLHSRLEMGNLYFIPLFVILSLLYAILASFFEFFDGILYVQLLIIQILMIYGPLVVVPYFSFRTGARKLLFFTGVILVVESLIWGVIWWNYVNWIWDSAWIILFGLLMGEDLHGLTPIYKSELGETTWKKGKDHMGFLGMSFKLNPYGRISMEQDACIGCRNCVEVCPRNLYTFDEESKKAALHDPDLCINCNACVRRCLGKCLTISEEK